VTVHSVYIEQAVMVGYIQELRLLLGFALEMVHTVYVEQQLVGVGYIQELLVLKLRVSVVLQTTMFLHDFCYTLIACAFVFLQLLSC